VVALEKLAGIEGQDSEEEQFLWLESGREEMETVKRMDKGKERKQSSDRVEEKRKVKEQEEEDAMEDVEERSSSFSLVAYSVRTGAK